MHPHANHSDGMPAAAVIFGLGALAAGAAAVPCELRGVKYVDIASMSLAACCGACLAFSAGMVVLRQRRGQRRTRLARRAAVAGMFLGALGPLALAASVALVLVPHRRAAELADARARVSKVTQAILRFEAEKGYLPRDITDSRGEPLLSWRVHVLPYLGERRLFSRFALDEPWNSERNLPMSAEMPRVFAELDSGVGVVSTSYTCLLLPKGKELIAGAELRGVKLRMKSSALVDGARHTLLLVQSDPSQAALWTKPGDLDVDLTQPKRGLTARRRGAFLASFADGKTCLIPATIQDDELSQLLTPDGRTWGRPDTIPADEFRTD